MRPYHAIALANARSAELPDDFDEDVWRQRLEAVLRNEVLPRLNALHPQLRPKDAEGPEAPDVEAFCSLLIAPTADGAARFLDQAAKRGLDFEALIERLIVPAARRLGELWHEDRYDFFDVTFGVGRLQELIDLLGPSVAGDRDGGSRVLLISLPGDSHHLGLDVVGAFLREAGWNVTAQHGLGPEEAARTVAQERFAVVGVTVGGSSFLEAAARTVETVRRASSNPHIAVMVGGDLINRRPELVARLGADASAPDGPTAVVLAKRLMLRQSERAQAAR